MQLGIACMLECMKYVVSRRPRVAIIENVKGLAMESHKFWALEYHTLILFS